MTAAPAAILGAGRGPDWSPEARQRAASLFAAGEAEAASGWLVEAQGALGLDEHALGTLAAAVTRSWSRQDADALLWTELARLKLTLHCDLYELVQVDPLAHLCGGFIGQRVRHAPDPLHEAAALVQVWCVRLSGLPMTYSYLTADELDRFAGIVSRFAADSLADEAARAKLLRGVARTLQAYVWGHAAALAVPACAPPSADTVWDRVSWQEGQDSIFLYPKR